LLWWSFPLAALFAVARVWGTSAINAARDAVYRARNYQADLSAAETVRDKAMAAAAEQTAQAADLFERVRQLEAEARQAFVRGVSEGRRRAVSEIAASVANPDLQLEALVYQDEKLLLVARVSGGQPPPSNGRFFLRVRNTRAKAALAVAGFDADENAVLFEVDEVVDRAFMDGLAAGAAAGSPEPPASLRVAARDAVTGDSFLYDEWGEQ
jgi:hypothetical protein